MATSFAETLIAFRREHKFTQTQLGLKLGIDPSRICRAERGFRPSSNLIERLNKVFGVQAHEWLEDKDPNTDPTLVPIPRVVHLRAPNAQEGNDELSLRARAVALLERMMDMLETITRNSRGGGGGGRGFVPRPKK